MGMDWMRDQANEQTNRNEQTNQSAN